VHAASFIKKRSIVLESELLRRKHLLRAILVHELFHFVWVRCGNERRRQFSALLREEILTNARGELGESSETWKDTWRQSGESRPTPNDRRWREYVCESFCDTAAWYLSVDRYRLPVTLARRWQRKRAAWFADWLQLESDGLRA
jgi:hypothetical protein